jgi:hypothetical protein
MVDPRLNYILPQAWHRVTHFFYYKCDLAYTVHEAGIILKMTNIS